MKCFTIVAIYSLLTAVAAFPVEKRDIVYQTVVQEIIETVEVITTIYVPPSAAVLTSTSAAAPVSASASPSDSADSLVFPSTSIPAPSSTPLPSSSTPPPPPPPPSTTSTPPPAPPASTTPASPAGGAGPFAASVLPGAIVSDGCFAGSPCTGDITFNPPMAGNTACGGSAEDYDGMTLAVSSKVMGSLSNGDVLNPLCGKTIRITDPSTGKTATGKIIDKCPGCAGDYDIDLGPPLFEQFYPQSKGRQSGITWYFE